MQVGLEGKGVITLLYRDPKALWLELRVEVNLDVADRVLVERSRSMLREHVADL